MEAVFKHAASVPESVALWGGPGGLHGELALLPGFYGADGGGFASGVSSSHGTAICCLAEYVALPGLAHHDDFLNDALFSSSAPAEGAHTHRAQHNCDALLIRLAPDCVRRRHGRANPRPQCPLPGRQVAAPGRLARAAC